LRKNALKSKEQAEFKLKELKDYLTKNLNPENLEKIARDTGFITRSSKIDAFKFLTCLLFNEQSQKDTSLLNLKADFLKYYDCDITRVALHKRFNTSAVEFMKTILSEHISQRFDTGNDLKAKFNSIRIKDSSKFSIPKSLYKDYPGYNGFHPGLALMNIQYEFDLLSGDWKYFEITKATRNDQHDSKTTLDNINRGDLSLRDLGYVTMCYLKGVISKQAYFVNRLPTSLKVYYADKEGFEEFEWKKIDRQMTRGKLTQLELNVLLGKKEQLPVRLIIAPVPEDVYLKRIKNASKHARSKGVQLSDDYKIKSRYNLFITNATPQQISTKEVANIYGLRWQIELIFKTWKSNLKIHMTKKVKKERFECQLIAKIIWIVINWRLFQIANHILKKRREDSGCSVHKFYKEAQKFSVYIKNFVIHKKPIDRWFRDKFYPLISDLITEQKKGKTTHCQVVSESLIL
jgi:hypothetical protein